MGWSNRSLSWALSWALAVASGMFVPLASAEAATVPPLPLDRLPVTQPTVWVCKPGDPSTRCNQAELDVSVESADGNDVHWPFVRPADPPIDCFYVYPTVEISLLWSNLPLFLHEDAIDDAVDAVTLAQAARFQSVCRVYAPLYRQMTLLWIGLPLLDTITRTLTGTAPIQVAQDDILSAWHDYLIHYNQGRGVVLIGHSQGTAMLTNLIKNEIDNDAPEMAELVAAERARLISAMLLGGNVTVPAPGAPAYGSDGKYNGDFPHLPPCSADHPTGCVVALSNFDATQGVPPSGGFGRSTDPTRQVLCSNPSDLVHSLLTQTSSNPYTDRFLLSEIPTQRLVGDDLGLTLPKNQLPIEAADFAGYFGRFRGACRYDAAQNASWFQVTDTNSAAYAWDLPASSGGLGLHVQDVNLHLGALISLARTQGTLWQQ